MISKLLSYFLGTWVLGYLMPKPQNTPPATLDGISAPIAEEGAEISVLFGSKFVNGANVVWYGDLKTQAIKKSGGKK